MPSHDPIPNSPAQPFRISLAEAIRTGVALMALAAFALSYDALRQMATASHIHPALTYAFPLVIDGFIAIGIGALLVLRTAHLRARLYVAGLVSLATATSIWANVLHAVRLNQQTGHTGLLLDDVTVGVISATAPLALAGAVHLYLIVQRRPAPPEPQAPAPAPAINRAMRARPGRGSVAAPKPQLAEDVAQPQFEQVAEPSKPTAERSGQLVATFEQVVEIGRTAPLGRGGRVSRRRVEEAVRAKGLGAGKDLLERAKKDLQAELDAAEANVA
ncbi:DUF2637 domain-containing protein [Streptomyces sp. AB3(2024)]|uniref:DUF2637 domain-containing protein n=1 Tax=Streptomyces sp. AB3(2024) TaxID=3317321 RepID=UPI0035A2D068